MYLNNCVFLSIIIKTKYSELNNRILILFYVALLNTLCLCIAGVLVHFELLCECLIVEVEESGLEFLK